MLGHLAPTPFVCVHITQNVVSSTGYKIGVYLQGLDVCDTENECMDSEIKMDGEDEMCIEQWQTTDRSPIIILRIIEFTTSQIFFISFQSEQYHNNQFIRW